jgi:hypothetical protein
MDLDGPTGSGSLLDMNLTRSKPSPSQRATRDPSPDLVAPLNRRAFLRTTALGGAMVVFGAPALLRGQNLNNRLGIGIIGCGGRGGFAVEQSRGENIVALCDVAEDRLNQVGAKHPRARRYVDFRKLLDAAGDLDAVTVSTADHTHAFATLWALQQRKHVYCEKPLTHSIEEARVIAEAAAEARVATQMGTQIHASSELSTRRRTHPDRRRRAGAGGARVAVAGVGLADAGGSAGQPGHHQHPGPSGGIVAGAFGGLHWDLFVGPAPDRPFHEVYWPGPNGIDGGTLAGGTMSDMGSHLNDLPFWALELRDPLTIEAEGPPPHREIAPASMLGAIHLWGTRPVCLR